MTDQKASTAKVAAKAADVPKTEVAPQPAPVQGTDTVPSTAPGQTQVVKLTQAQAMELQTRQWNISLELFRLIHRDETPIAKTLETYKAAKAAVFSTGSVPT